MLSGHLGGANSLAGHLATALGAIPVLTTASDARQTLAVDLLGRELDWKFEATHDEIVRCSAAVVNDEPVALVQEAGSEDGGAATPMGGVARWRRIFSALRGWRRWSATNSPPCCGSASAICRLISPPNWPASG